MKKLNQIIENNILPPVDKLKHAYLGSFIFVVLLWLNIIASEWIGMLQFWHISLVVVFLSVVWEFSQKKSGGTNSKTEMANDIIFGNIFHVAISLASLALSY